MVEFDLTFYTQRERSFQLVHQVLEQTIEFTISSIFQHQTQPKQREPRGALPSHSCYNTVHSRLLR